MMHIEVEIIAKNTLGPFIVEERSDGLIYIELKEFLEDVELKTIKELVDLMGKIGNGKPVKAIVNIVSFNTISEDAKKYIASEEGQRFTKANAIVIHSFATKLGANFFIKFNKPVTPTRVFNSVDEAVKWLHGIQ
jgi:hypothetical protein